MKIATQNSFSFKRQQAIGRAFSKRLEKFLGTRLTQRQVGAKLGLSYEGVRKIEYRALYKIAIGMKGQNQ